MLTEVCGRLKLDKRKKYIKKIKDDNRKNIFI